MKYKRDVAKQVVKLTKFFPVMAVTGPRQAGKTTFLQDFFPDYKYYNLEKIETLKLVKEDSWGILANNPRGVIIDEIQKYPEMMSDVQAYVDKTKKMGR